MAHRIGKGLIHNVTVRSNVTMNQLTKTARDNVQANETLNRDNRVIAWSCGVVLAVLCVAFFL